MLGLIALFGGLAIGLGCFLRFMVGLGLWAMAPQSPESLRKHRLSVEKKAWLKSLSPEDRAAFLLHEKRKVQYVKLRAKFERKLNQRILEEFRRIKPSLQIRERLRQQIANAMWVEWNMDSWDDINLAEDCPYGLAPAWGQCPSEDKYLPPEPLWEPPPRSTYAK